MIPDSMIFNIYNNSELIQKGLKEGQKFPSEFHEVLASILAYKNEDIVTEIVQAILKVPNERIENITYGELIKEFGMPILK